MIVVKKLSSFNVKSFILDEEQPDSREWVYDPIDCEYSPIILYGNLCNKNRIDYINGLITEEFIEFNKIGHSLKVDIKIPEDLIPYTKCYYITAKTKMEKISNDSGKITYQGMLRFIYNGPKESSILWKLSI